MQEIDIKIVKEKLAELKVTYEDNIDQATDKISKTAYPLIANMAEIYGYDSHPILVDISTLEGITSGDAVVVTSQNTENDNGVYLFCIQADYSVGLIILIPSTISKTTMIAKIVGDITTAIDGVIVPALTTYDKVEIVGQVLADTVLKPLMKAMQIPEDKEGEFISNYFPMFMANVTRWYLGKTSDHEKPIVNEPIVDMEPYQVKEMLLNPEFEENKTKHTKSNMETDDVSTNT